MLPVNDLFGAVSVALGEPLIATGRWHDDHWGLFSAGAVVTGFPVKVLQQGTMGQERVRSYRLLSYGLNAH